MFHVDNQSFERIEDQLREEFRATMLDETVGSLLPLFSEHFFERIKSLKHSLNIKDIVGALRLTHQSKGAAAMYGFRTIQNFFSSMEHELQQNELPVSDQAVNNLIIQIDAIEAMYQRVATGLQPNGM